MTKKVTKKTYFLATLQ